MKTMKRAMLLLLAFAMLFTMAACAGPADEPEMTAELLLEKTAEAMEGRAVTAAHAAIVLDADITAEGETMNMGMDMTMDLLSSTDPYAAYVDMDTNISMMGETMSESYEMYMTVEDDKVMAYYYMEAYEYWSSTEVGSYSEIVAGAQSDFSWMLEKTEATLSETTETVDGTEVYVLDLVITAEQMEAVIGSMQNSLDTYGVGELNMDDIPVTLRIDAESYTIRQMDINMMSMEDMMNEMMASMGVGEDSSTGVVFNEFTYVFSGMSYEAVEVPAVPDEAKANAIPMDLGM